MTGTWFSGDFSPMTMQDHEKVRAMQEAAAKANLAYVSAASVNTSGIRPMEYNVLVKPVDVEKTTKAGLILPESAVEKEEFGRMEGTLVAVSPMAFSFAEWPKDREAEKPQVGQRVTFSRYQATELTGKDGAKYWMMKDKSILGVIE